MAPMIGAFGGGHAVASAVMRLHWDTSRLRPEAAEGIRRSNLGALGREHGGRFGSGFAGGFRNTLLPAIGGVIGAAGAIIGGAALFAEVTKSATQFQAAMTRIQTQAGASAGDVRLLGRQVLALGGQVQQGPEHLADALYHLKSVGMDNVAAMKALRVASDLAAVGGADLESTTNALAGAWRSGIRGAHSFRDAAGTVNAIIGAGNMRMQDFVSAISTGILPAARTFGLSLGQVGGALALMTDEGIPAIDAATRLRMSFSLLGAPSMAADKQLHLIGLTGLQLADAMRSRGGLIAAISLLKEHLDKSGLSASKQAQILSRAFGGGRSSSAILTLLNNLEVLRRKQEQVNNSTGKYGPAVAAQRKTAEAQFALLRSAVETFGVRVGNVVLPALTKIVTWINSTGLPAVGHFFNRLSAVFRLFSGGGSHAPSRRGPFIPLPGPRQEPGQARGREPSPGPLAPGTGEPGQVRGREPGGGGPVTPPAPQISGWQRFFDTLRSGAMTVIHALAPAFRDWKTTMISVWGSVKIVWAALQPLLGPLIKLGLIAIVVAFRLIEFVAAHVVAPAIRLLAIVVATALKAIWASVQLLAALLQGAWNGMRIAGVAVWHFIRDAGVEAWGRIRGAWSVMTGFYSRLFRDVSSFAQIAWDYMQLGALYAVRFILNWFSKIPIIGHLFKGVASVANDAIQSIQDKIHGLEGKQVKVGVAFYTSGGVTHPGPRGTGGAGFGAAEGGEIRGPGGPRDDKAGLFALSNREWVIRANSAAGYGLRAMQAVNEGRAIIHYRQGGTVRAAGMADGGPVTDGAYIRPHAVISPPVPVVRHQMNDALNRILLTWAKSVNFGQGTGSQILQYASQFANRVPYVWGGATPRGWDCSGFVSYVYEHFRLLGQRMVSQTLQQWATPSGPVPGGMVFFGRPAYHVGFVAGRGRMLSALNEHLGTIYSGMGGNSGYGVPPRGFAQQNFAGPAGGGGGWRGAGREMAARYGWTGAEWFALDRLWNRESGWNANARNPTSGAAGIPQDITGNMHGGGRGQIAWGLNYIRGRYGDPLNAWAHELSHGWYDRGGYLPPGVSLAVNNTGRPERVVAPGQDRPEVHVHLGGVVVQERADVDLISRRIAHSITAASFG